MNKAQKFLLDRKLDDIVLNKKEYPENKPENTKKWIYLSDLLEDYSVHENMVTSTDNNKCGCGRYTECCAKLHSNTDGKLWTETNEHFRCGKVQNQISKMIKWFNKN